MNFFVTAIQAVLQEAKHLLKEVDGLWDKHTQEAYDTFAANHGLPSHLVGMQPISLESIPEALRSKVETKMNEIASEAKDAAKSVESEVDSTVDKVEEAVGHTETPEEHHDLQENEADDDVDEVIPKAPNQPAAAVDTSAEIVQGVDTLTNSAETANSAKEDLESHSGDNKLP